jgi:drug/metabolite transporter (DMT)-like permease
LETSRQTIVTGVVLMLIGTLCASGADAALKAVASGYAAPQVLLIAALMSLGLTVAANGNGTLRRVVHTGAPIAMAGRAVATVLAALGFYQAFVMIPFAEVFLFIGAMPLMAAGLSRLILGERPGARVWGILGVGFLGLFCLFPSVTTSSGWAGHAFAAFGSVAGTVSVVLSRHIGKHDTHSLAQVFLPQLAMALVMALFWPFVARPMGIGDLAMICVYACFVFCARWIMVIVARMLPAWLTLQLLNMQFVWMVLIGMLVFGETTGPFVFLGAGLIILAGILLARQEMTKHDASPAQSGLAKPQKSVLHQGAVLVRHAARAGR